MAVLKPLIILGTGGNCIDILDTVWEINRVEGDTYQCMGFLDDNPDRWGNLVHGVPVLGPLSSAHDLPNSLFVNGIGSFNNFWRKQAIIAKTDVPLEQFETIVHPSASVSRMAHLGAGTVVLQNAVVASNAQIGNHVMVLPLSVVSHEVCIGEYTAIAGGVCLSGNVEIGRSCYVGSNASIRNSVVVGDCSLIGMGSVVLDDVPPNSVVVGSPAKFLRNVMETGNGLEVQL